MFNDDYKYSYNPTCVKKSTVLLISNDETTFDEYCMMAFLAGEFSKEKKSFTIEEITKKISEEKDSKDYTVKEVYEIIKKLLISGAVIANFSHVEQKIDMENLVKTFQIIEDENDQLQRTPTSPNEHT